MNTHYYRIVQDSYAGYEVQRRAWWNPFWFRRANTHPSVERAEAFAHVWAKPFVKDLGRLPSNG